MHIAEIAPFRRSMALISALAAALPAALAGQQEGPEMSVEPQFPLYHAVLGPLDREITTDSPTAQEYYRQGMQMMYAFTLPAAIASFEEAQRQDPDCAMCYFGEAWARGPFLNGRMQAQNAPEAFEAIQRALDLAEETGATPVEMALIEAMSLRYTEEEDEARRPQLDSLYSRTMADVYRAFPDDLDVGTMYAESIMLLNPTRAQYRLGDPFVQSFHRVLEDVLSKDITHPGACHLYVHATEATEDPGKAEACADFLGATIPGSSHINHMPSHTYNEIGRWKSGVRANIQAWHSDQRAAWEEGVSYAATHNLHMLFFAGSMSGQGGVSLRAAKAYADQVPGGIYFEALVMLRFGWFDEILELDEVPEDAIPRGLYEFSRGYAHLRMGEADLAAVYRDRVLAAAESIPDDVLIRNRHTAAQLLGITGAILEGEILREEGRLEDAIDAFERAVEIHEGLNYDEPEPLNFGAHHWLGAALLEAGRPTDAEATYRASLEMHPHNGWSVFGLEQALRAQGRTAEAEEANAWFRDVWSDADTVIRGSHF